MRTPARCLALLTCLQALMIATGRADPPFYQKQATWQETMRVSREALIRSEAEAAKPAAAITDPALLAFQPFGAQLHYGRDPVRIRVDVSGLQTLCIRTRNLKESRRGRGTVCFGTPSLIATDATATPVTNRRPLFRDIYGSRNFRDERDGRWRNAKLDAAQPTPRFARGFMIQKDAEVVLDLGGKYTRFEAWACMLPSESTAGDTVQIAVDCRPILATKQTAEESRKKVWELVRRDFATPHHLQEQELELRAGIWRHDWSPGDVAELARRYTRACDGAVQAKAEELRKAAAKPADLTPLRGLFYLRDTRERLAFAKQTLEFVERAAPRPRLVAELAALEQAYDQAIKQPDAAPPGLHLKAMSLRRRIILSHPTLAFDRLLINKRVLPRYNHMCDQYLGRHSGIGPGLVVLDHWKDNPTETPLLEGKLPPGATHHPDLSFDGTRILFAYCSHAEQDSRRRRFWIYEIGVDGSGLRQLTGTPTDPRAGWEQRETVLIEDWDPCYLPDGGLAFISTRSQSFGRCHGSRYVPTYMVYRANGDGSGIRQLSFGEANEWDPSVLHDGRIIYTRWDYINRHDTIFQSLWTMHPDGTATAHFYGNYSRGPCMIAEARAIPGSTKVVATATDHHGFTAGSIIVIDPSKGQDEGPPLRCITPELGWPEGGPPRDTTFAPRPPSGMVPPEGQIMGGRRAATPFPLSEDLFLAAYAHGSHHAIYLIDGLGGRELIYRDASISCFAPIPIRPTPRPPVLQSLVAKHRDEKTGIFHLLNIYQSDQPLEPGGIKRLRINRIYGQPTRSKPSLSLANNEIIKGIVGTVPVNGDGSVTFRAPAGVPLQFQALDEHGMAVMTMRSLVYLQPGEQMSCVGCHEPRSSPPPQGLRPQKVTVREIEPPAGPRYEGGFSFARTVQPVLDRHCIGCHGLGKTEGRVNLLGTRTKYNQAHDTLTSRSGLVAIAYRNRETGSSKPKDYFAHAGKLVQVLREKHKDRVKLPPADLQRLIDWLDLNAQFYGDYSHNRVEHRRDGNGEKALRAHIAATLGDALAKQPFEALVNLALPTESRILNAPFATDAGGWGQIAKGGWKSRDDPGYQKILALVQACCARQDRHDIAGTCGGGKRCSCGCCWVRELRAEAPKKPY